MGFYLRFGVNIDDVLDIWWKIASLVPKGTAVY